MILHGAWSLFRRVFMEIRKGPSHYKKDSWHYRLYRFGSSLSKGKGKGSYADFWTYWSRATLSAAFVAYFIAIKWAGLVLLFILINVPAVILTAAANLVTIPLGFGISLFSFEEKFLKTPFQVLWLGEWRSLAWFLVPFWALIANVAVFYGSNEVIMMTVWSLSLIGYVCYLYAIKVAKKGSMLIEFVEPHEEIKELPV